MDKKEVWKGVEGYPGYEISDFGNLRSFRSRHGLLENPRILESHLDKGGYRVACLQKIKSHQLIYIHVLVLETFVCKRPKGMFCRHLDGDSLNNKLSNLKWGTPKENSEDQKKHGTQIKGEACGMSKLKNKEVVIIKKALKIGLKGLQLAQLFNVTPSTIYSIKQNKTWTHI